MATQSKRLRQKGQCRYIKKREFEEIEEMKKKKGKSRFRYMTRQTLLESRSHRQINFCHPSQFTQKNSLPIENARIG